MKYEMHLNTKIGYKMGKEKTSVFTTQTIKSSIPGITMA